jgi:hypothetical protein
MVSGGQAGTVLGTIAVEPVHRGASRRPEDFRFAPLIAVAALTSPVPACPRLFRRTADSRQCAISSKLSN